jgi:hypothetical protein
MSSSVIFGGYADSTARTMSRFPVLIAAIITSSGMSRAGRHVHSGSASSSRLVRWACPT